MIKLIHNALRRIIHRQQQNGVDVVDDVMGRLNESDRAQVKAILMTHAEMQDRRTLESEVVLGRLLAEEPDEIDMIDDLKQSIEDCTEDSENLKRIANYF